MPFLVASVFLIILITFTIRLQASTIEELDKVTMENNQRLSYKAAGSTHILGEGERFGVLTETQYKRLTQACGSFTPGFSGDPLTLKSSDCESLYPLPVPVQVLVTGEEDTSYSNRFEISEYNIRKTRRKNFDYVINTRLGIGETNEGFN